MIRDKKTAKITFSPLQNSNFTITQLVAVAVLRWGQGAQAPPKSCPAPPPIFGQ